MKIAVLVLALGLSTSLSARSQSLNDQIREQERAIADLHKEVDPKVTLVLVTDADLRTWISQVLLGVTVQAYNNQANKTFHFRSTGEIGQLKNSNGGAAGCGWYVALEPNSECRSGQAPHSACADMAVPHLGETYNSDGSIDLSADFSIDLAAQIHGHVKGPAGPCSLFKWSCDCPIGGGAGTSVHVDTQKDGTVFGKAEITSDKDHWFAYTLRLTSPQSIDTTLRPSLQVPFDGSIVVGVPISVPLPMQVLAAGGAPQIFAGDGFIKVGDPPVFTKKYSFDVTPKSFSADSTGYVAKASTSVVWK